MMGFLMTILAFGEGYSRLEIIMSVAILASHRLMLSEQRKFCFRMVEPCHLCYSSPARRIVAAFAGPLESSLVRIDVASSACLEGKARVFDIRLRVRVLEGGVALPAVHLFVRSGQRIFRVRVFEEGCRLPARYSVASRAVRPNLATMFIRVAVHTIAR